MKEGKSLKFNMLLNAIKGVMGILFPLITFPYVSKVLGIYSVGRYNFANSIISYFSSLAGLGIATYAIREGAKLRDSSDKMSFFADEMFSINIISTICSYVLLAVCLVVSNKLDSYMPLLLILSLSIIFKTIGVEWIYSIYEDYTYITIRSIAFQFISMMLLFIFVRNSNDVYNYAVITVVSSVGSNILNYFHAKKYCSVSIKWNFKNINWKKHMGPIMVLFATSAAVMVYVSSDTTILGFLTDDYHVGLYSVSVKIYTLVKTVLSSVLVVSIPRLSVLLGKHDEEQFSIVAKDIYETLLTLLMPAMVGIILLRKDIILIIADSTYLEAAESLLILSIAILFCLGTWFWQQCILLPLKKEKEILIITCVCALVNVILNFILIPVGAEKAAAFTTLIAELIGFIWSMYIGKRCVKIDSIFLSLIKVVFGCMLIFIESRLVNLVELGTIAHATLLICMAVPTYLFSQIALKNQAIYGIVNKLIKKRRSY